MTRTRARAVPRSRIKHGQRRRPLRSRRSLRAARAGSRSAAGRRAARRRRSRAHHRRTAEKSEEIALWAQYEGGIAAIERLAIGLQRSVEGEELLILAERVGIDFDRLRV